MERDPVRAHEARELIRNILVSGRVYYSTHVRQRMDGRSFTEQDVRNILRSGTVHEAEWENGSWRYQITSAKFNVVVALESETILIVVTGMRL